MSRRIVFGEGAYPHADDAADFDERQVERNLGYVAGRKPDDQKTPAPCHVPQRELRVLAADRVVDHVDAFALGDRLHARAHVFTDVIDRFIGAVLAAHRELLVARSAGNHLGAEHLADLDRGETYAPGGTEHE